MEKNELALIMNTLASLAHNQEIINSRLIDIDNTLEVICEGMMDLIKDKNEGGDTSGEVSG